jgi:hypothetical protein
MINDLPTLNKTDYETVPPGWELIRDRPVNRSADDNTNLPAMDVNCPVKDFLASLRMKLAPLDDN